MHSKKLSEMGRVVQSAPPLCAEHIMEHGKCFLVSQAPDSDIDKRDIMLHDFFLTAMNCGIRYDEFCKLRMENLKATKYDVEFGIAQRTKNSTSYRSYTLREWPGKCFAKSIMMDPLFVFSAGIHGSGNLPGLIFCNIDVTTYISRMILSDSWPRKLFVQFMTSTFIEIGIGSGIMKAHSGHSPKRGRVQQLRFLVCKDSYIMRWFGMTGQMAYLRYTKSFNNVCGTPVPDFAPTDDMISHAQNRTYITDFLASEKCNEVCDWM